MSDELEPLVIDRAWMLTARERFFLEALWRAGPDKAVSKAALMHALYGIGSGPEIKIIDVWACKVRAKLLKFGLAPAIDTVWGKGYIIREEGRELLRNGVGASAERAA